MDKHKVEILVKETDKTINETIKAFAKAMSSSPLVRKEAPTLMRRWTKTARQEYITKLKKAPEEEFQETLDRMSNAKSQLRKALMEVAKTMPKPKGGRPRKLNPVASRRAIAEIAALVHTGQSISAAIASVAEHFKVKPRHMQNLWEHRAEIQTTDALRP